MATSTLTSLAAELLDEIIIHSLPEGFEGLALTCRKLYNLCTPLIEHYNQRRKRFREFTYLYYPQMGLFSVDNPTMLTVHSPPAVVLIQDIAHNPVVARYIRHADFTYDTWPPAARPLHVLPDPDLGGPVVAMFAESPYLRAAGLDWRQYYALIQEELETQGRRYSQHAAAFLLTLLPNVTSLKLPCLWRPCEMADKLIHTIIHIAVNRLSPSSSLWDTPSLAQVTEFEPYSESGPPGHRIAMFEPFKESGPSGHGLDLADAVPFLALPKLRSFRARSCVARDSASLATASEDAGLPPGDTLEAARFFDSCLDDVAMATFLRRTPNLKELAYSHYTEKETTQDLDLCKLVMAIEREAGSHLESIKIEIWGPFIGSLAPGMFSMHGFQRLCKLHLPLMIAVSNLATDVSTRNKEQTDQELRGLQRFTDILVPASVSELSFYSLDPDCHVKALRVMFCDFAARKDDWGPALESIRLIPKPKEDGPYKDVCDKLKVEMEEAGVTLHLGGDPGKDEWDEEVLLEE